MTINESFSLMATWWENACIIDDAAKAGPRQNMTMCWMAKLSLPSNNFEVLSNINCFRKLKSNVFFPIDLKGAKQRAKFCRRLSEQTFPLTKSVIQSIADEFNLLVRSNL